MLFSKIKRMKYMTVQFENNLNRSQLLKNNMWLLKDGGLRDSCLYSDPSDFQADLGPVSDADKVIILKENVGILSKIANGKFKLDYVSNYSERLLKGGNLSDNDLMQGVIVLQYAIQSKSVFYKQNILGILTKLFLKIFRMWNNGMPRSIAIADSIRNNLITALKTNQDQNENFLNMLKSEHLAKTEEITQNGKKETDIRFLSEGYLPL